MRWAAVFAVLLAQPAGWKPPAVRIQQSGTTQGYASTLNCIGAGISCSVGASVATVNVTGGGGGSATPGGVSGNVQINSAGAFGAYTGTTCSYAVKSLDANGAAACTAAPTIPTPGGSGSELQTRASATTFGAYAGTSCAYAVKTLGVDGVATCTAAPTIPADISGAHYVTTQAEAGLSAEAVLPACTGTDKLTFNGTTISCATDQTGGGAVAGTDKQIIYNNAGAYAGNANLTFDQATGAVGIGAPTFLTNNPLGVAGNVNGFVQVAIQNKSAGTSASSDFVATADNGTNTANFVDLGINSSTYSDASYTIGGALSGYLFSNGGDLTVGTQTAAKVLKLHTGGTLAANLRATLSDTAFNLASGVGLQANGASGTSTQVLHGAASGSQTWSAVGLTTDVTGTLPVSNGGTNSTATPTNGGVGYGTGTAHAYTAAGTAGQSLFSGGAAIPSWADAQKLVRLSADYTNATTSMTNTALTWTSPAAVSRSAFICQLMVKSSATTTGGQFDVNVSVAPTTITYGLTWITGAGTAPGTGGTSAFVQAAASATALGPAATSLTTYTLWRLEGIIVHTSSAATVTVRGKAPAAGTLTVGSGSNCQYYVL